MRDLLRADWPRALRSRCYRWILLFALFLGAGCVLICTVETNDRRLLLAEASNNLVMFLSMFMAVLSGALSVIAIAVEFSSGVIRNKCIIGHRRSHILFAWVLIYSMTTVLSFLAFFSAFFLALLCSGAALSQASAGAIAGNLLLILLFMLKFQMFSLLAVCIYPDVKTAVICYLLSNASLIPIMLASVDGENDEAVGLLSRFFFVGFLNDFQLDATTAQPWLTALCVLSLGAGYLLLALAYFQRKELK